MSSQTVSLSRFCCDGSVSHLCSHKPYWLDKLKWTKKCAEECTSRLCALRSSVTLSKHNPSWAEHRPTKLMAGNTAPKCFCWLGLCSWQPEAESANGTVTWLYSLSCSSQRLRPVSGCVDQLLTRVQLATFSFKQNLSSK